MKISNNVLAALAGLAIVVGIVLFVVNASPQSSPEQAADNEQVPSNSTTSPQSAKELAENNNSPQPENTNDTTDSDLSDSKKNESQNQQDNSSDENQNPLRVELAEWITAWQSHLPSLDADNFEKTGQEEFTYAFNEVRWDDRKAEIPNVEQASAASPNGEMTLNYTFHYNQPGFSGVVLENPRGEDRLFRVAYCDTQCRYHWVKWLSNTEFLAGQMKEDTRACEEGASYKECPETLAYDHYNLETMQVTHYTHQSDLGDLRAEFPQEVCAIYAPCQGQE